MNCREAQTHLFAERDGVLDNTQRVALDAHLLSCGGCRQARENLSAALVVWRTSVTQATVPDAEREWHAVRRRIRGGQDAGAVRESRPRRTLFPWLAVPLGAAAAAAVAFLVYPDAPVKVSPTKFPAPHVARANSVEVPGNNATTMVFVDDKSGWLFVWASDANSKQG